MFVIFPSPFQLLYLCPIILHITATFCSFAHETHWAAPYAYLPCTSLRLSSWYKIPAYSISTVRGILYFIKEAALQKVAGSNTVVQTGHSFNFVISYSTTLKLACDLLINGEWFKALQYYYCKYRVNKSTKFMQKKETVWEKSNVDELFSYYMAVSNLPSVVLDSTPTVFGLYMWLWMKQASREWTEWNDWNVTQSERERRTELHVWQVSDWKQAVQCHEQLIMLGLCDLIVLYYIVQPFNFRRLVRDGRCEAM